MFAAVVTGNWRRQQRSAPRSRSGPPTPALHEPAGGPPYMPDQTNPKLGTAAASLTIGDAEIRFESGKLAAQAGGAVVASCGDTVLLVTTTASSRPKEHLDFFPL